MYCSRSRLHSSGMREANAAPSAMPCRVSSRSNHCSERRATSSSRIPPAVDSPARVRTWEPSRVLRGSGLLQYTSWGGGAVWASAAGTIAVAGAKYRFVATVRMLTLERNLYRLRCCSSSEWKHDAVSINMLSSSSLLLTSSLSRPWKCNNVGARMRPLWVKNAAAMEHFVSFNKVTWFEHKPCKNLNLSDPLREK